MKKDIMHYIIFGIIFICVLFAAWWGFYAPASFSLQLLDRRSSEIIFETEVIPGDELCLEIEHSFEHIPWFEYYTILSDTRIRLDAIAVAGYGAGIPAEMDVPTRIEDGLIWMEEINSYFNEFKWLTSNNYMKEFSLNGTTIFDFRTLPDASLILGRIIIRKGHFSNG